MSDANGAAAVRYEVADGVATVTLNRPSALNAINSGIRAQLPEAILQAERDDGVRAIVLRGAGERAFCAGADITEFAPPDSLVESRAGKQHPMWVDVVAGVGKPTIAAIHGYCLGGGLELALACDVRIAADDAVFGLPEVTLGIIPGAGGTQRLPRVVGIAHALRIVLSGERFPAPQALGIGLVSAVVATTELASASREWAQRFTRGAPRAVAYAKEAILRGAEMALPDGLALEADLSTLLQSTGDRMEGATAFRERRTPQFRGC
jgi:enoyl-CoA hydratase